MLIVIILLLVLLYLLAIKPNLNRKYAFKPYEETYIAHRGLFNNKDVPENSILAFKKAVENNYGIELDVQLTSDDKLVVFHDESLDRICGINKLLRECTLEELQGYSLLDTKERIPLFTDVLKVLKKDTPLIIEVKPEGRCIDAVKQTIEIIRNYDGIYNIESFNPKVVYYLRKHKPDIIRGQLSYDYLNDPDSKLNKFTKLCLTNLLFNFLTKPDYIAYDCTNTKNLSFKIISKIYKGECVAWTVKSDTQYNLIKDNYQCFIFDSYIPKNRH